MKLTLSQLVNLLSLSSGHRLEDCEAFLKEFFALTSEVLERGENVKIKGFGTFKLVGISPRKSVNVSTGEEYEIPAHSRIVFIASKELASLVNQPFSAFEAVEINDEENDEWKKLEETVEEKPESDDDLTVESDYFDSAEHHETLESSNDSDNVYVIEDFETEETETVKDQENLSIVDNLNDNDNINDVESHSDEKSEDSEKSEVCEINETSEDIEDENVGNDEYNENEMYSEDSVENEKKPKSRFGWGFLVGFLVCCAVFAIAGCFFYYTTDLKKFFNIQESEEINKENTDASLGKEKKVVVLTDSVLEAEEKEIADTLDVPSTMPSDRIVYDTVTTTHYLTTIAKEHYGNYNLWPYIYEENKSILGHPDRIKPGTKVVVPPLSKYGVDPKNPEDINHAKKIGNEIYARYKK